MKKTITINISGLVFNIEEDAYSLLKKYLENIGEKFQNVEERQEILQDIEARISELFTEKLNRNKEVINSSDVENIISIMGAPDNFEEEESRDYSEEKTESKSQAKKKNKKFYRDTDNSVLGGVCAGTANYFDWDVALVRVIFLMSVVFLGTGVLIYILFWIATPEAKSTSEKLAAKGKNATVDNISSFVTKVKTSFENIDTETFNRNFKKNSHKFNDFLVGTSKKIDKTFRPKENVTTLITSILSIIGFIIISLGIIILFSISYSFLLPYETGLNDLFNEFVEKTNFKLADAKLIKFAFIIFIFSIAISFILSGIRLAFRKENKLVTGTKPLRILSRFTLIFSIIGMVILLIVNKTSYSSYSHNKTHTLDYKTIVVQKLDNVQSNKNEKIKFKVKKTKKSTAWINIVVQGKGFRGLLNTLNNKPYDYVITDSIIKLSPFTQNNNEMNIEKNVAITLYLPDNDSTILINQFED